MTSYNTTTIKSSPVITTDTLFRWTAYLYIFSMCFCYNTGEFLMRLARVLIVVAWVVNLVDNRNRPLRLHKYFLWVGALMVYSLITCFTQSIDTQGAFDFWLSMLYTLVVTFILLDYLSYNKTFLFSLMKVFIFSIIVSLIRIYATHGLFSFLSARNVDGFNINGHAQMSIMGLFFCAYFALKNKELKVSKAKYIALAIIIAILNIFTFSRTSYLYVGATFLIYALISSKNIIRALINLAIAVIVIVVVYTLLLRVDFLYDIIGARLEGAINGVLGLGGDIDGSTIERTGLIEFGIEKFIKNPWFGHGLNGFCQLFALENGYAYYAHNNFVEMLVDLGIVGFVIYYSLYVYVLLKGIKLLRKNRTKHVKLFFALFVGSLISEYARVVYYVPQGQFIIMICLFALTYFEEKEEVKNA